MSETPRRLTESEQHAWRSFIRLQERLVGRPSREAQAELAMLAQISNRILEGLEEGCG